MVHNGYDFVLSAEKWLTSICRPLFLFNIPNNIPFLNFGRKRTCAVMRGQKTEAHQWGSVPVYFHYIPATPWGRWIQGCKDLSICLPAFQWPSLSLTTRVSFPYHGSMPVFDREPNQTDGSVPLHSSCYLQLQSRRMLVPSGLKSASALCNESSLEIAKSTISYMSGKTVASVQGFFLRILSRNAQKETLIDARADIAHNLLDFPHSAPARPSWRRRVNAIGWWSVIYVIREMPRGSFEMGSWQIVKTLLCLV